MNDLVIDAICNLLQIFLINCYTSPRVSIPDGMIEGIVSHDYYGNIYYNFRGIPYAKPPIGELRYRASVKNDPWDDVLNATMFPPVCPQPINNEIVGSEDCLYLNVYTPSFQYTLLKPVLVYIHGGSLFKGDAREFGPDYLMNENIVLVTVQYRIGVYGNLHILDKKNPENDKEFIPNNSLRDQVLALKWVQENIQYFGGNPKRVTLMGNSAGAACTHAQVLSPLSKGLFHRAIIMSGSAISAWLYGTPNSAMVVANYLNISTNDEDSMINQLKQATTEQLFGAADYFNWFGTRMHILPGFGIINENKPNSFMPDYPLNIIQTGQYPRMKMLIGNTNQEGLIILSAKTPSTIDPINDIPFFFQNPELVKDEVRNFYNLDANNILNNVSFYSYAWFKFNVFRAALEHKKTDRRTKLYYYEFSGSTPLNFQKTLLFPNSSFQGACHGDDLGYVFHVPGFPYATRGSVEERLVKNVIEIVSNFIKYGKPLRKWLPFKENVYNYANVTNDGVMLGISDRTSFEFWLQAYDTYSNGVY